MEKRAGSSMDVSNLQIALDGLGFQVFCFNDLGILDIRNNIDTRNFGLLYFLHSLLTCLYSNCQLQRKITATVIAS